MITTEAAKKQIETIKQAAVDKMDHITTNEKIVGAAVLGVAVGAVAAAIGSSLLHGGDEPAKNDTVDGEPDATKD